MKIEKEINEITGFKNLELLATQVVEAGLDVSADLLLTEVAPMNSLIQRAGRCARWLRSGELRPGDCWRWKKWPTPWSG